MVRHDDAERGERIGALWGDYGRGAALRVTEHLAVPVLRRGRDEPLSPLPALIDLEPRPGESAPSGRLRSFADLYAWLTVATTAVIVAPFAARLSLQTAGWTTFLILGTAVAIARIFVVVAPEKQPYQTAPVFLVAAALLLPPELIVLLGIAQHLPDLLTRGQNVRNQSFGIAHSTLTALGAWAAGQAVLDSHLFVGDAIFAAAGAATCIAYLVLGRALVAPMLKGTRGLTLRTSGLLTRENVATDISLVALGVGLAMLWEIDPFLTPFALLPLVLVQRSLAVPALKAEARNDPKTGLFNARHFMTTLHRELARAARLEHPMAVIMADLDLLRDINNTYGHLAGDAVLAGVARVFREELRTYDIPARFGGEEFSIVLPETPPHEALQIAERIRRAVAESGFAVETSDEPIHATVSVGVACFPRDGETAHGLMHQADLAVYRAKLQGRNRVQDASNEPVLAPGDTRARRLTAVVAAQEQVPGVHAGSRSTSMPRALAIVLFGLGSAGAMAGIVSALARTRTNIVELLAIPIGVCSLFVFALLFVLMRRTHETYLRHAASETQTLRQTEEIESRNASLEEVNRLLRERSTAVMATVSATVDARNDATAGHSRRVEQIALAIGAELSLSREELELLGYAALFHDLGRLSLPDAVLHKPSSLDDAEWALITRYPDDGASIISHLGFLNDAVPAIRHHHERFDGRGYPDRLMGDEIPLGARIIHVADAFDSMLSTRVYREAHSLAAALSEIEGLAGTQFCPLSASALRRVIERREPAMLFGSGTGPVAVAF